MQETLWTELVGLDPILAGVEVFSRYSSNNGIRRQETSGCGGRQWFPWISNMQVGSSKGMGCHIHQVDTFHLPSPKDADDFSAAPVSQLGPP
jgi:hypothetical protein